MARCNLSTRVVYIEDERS